jgi:hypothetical protein
MGAFGLKNMRDDPLLLLFIWLLLRAPLPCIVSMTYGTAVEAETFVLSGHIAINGKTKIVMAANNQQVGSRPVETRHKHQVSKVNRTHTH